MSPAPAASLPRVLVLPSTVAVRIAPDPWSGPNPDPDDDPPDETPVEDDPAPDDSPIEMPPNDDPAWEMPDEMTR